MENKKPNPGQKQPRGIEEEMKETEEKDDKNE